MLLSALCSASRKISASNYVTGQKKWKSPSESYWRFSSHKNSGLSLLTLLQSWSCLTWQHIGE